MEILYALTSHLSNQPRSIVRDLISMVLLIFWANILTDGPPLGQPLYSNYDEHHYDELLTIIDILTRKDVPILMGDINNGPATPGNTVWELPFHYGLIAARGFVSPYVLEDGRCTFCVDNPAVVNQLDKLIDHIYITTDSYKGRVVSSKVRRGPIHIAKNREVDN